MSLGVLPARLNLQAYQGDSYALKVTLVQEDETPLNLTDLEVEFSMAVVRGGRPSFQYTTLGPYVDSEAPETGVVNILIPAKETGKWQDIKYVHELTVRDYAGYAQTFLTGDFRVMREVRR